MKIESLDDKIQVTAVYGRCVYVNNYRIAGRKPYVSENLPQQDFSTPVRDVLDAFPLAVLEAAVAERLATRKKSLQVVKESLTSDF